jgi:hypothetical protein
MGYKHLAAPREREMKPTPRSRLGAKSELARLKKSNQGYEPRKEQEVTKTDSNTRENLRSEANTK